MTPILAHAGEEAAYVLIPAAVFFVLWRARRRRSGGDAGGDDAALERQLAAEFERRYGQGTYPGRARAGGESGTGDSGPAERLPS